MKTLALLSLTVAATAAVLPAQAATNIGVSIGINAPGQYGRIDIDNYPQPVLINTRPIVYQPSRVAEYQRPIYLYVPQVQQASWGNYCGRYRACGQPVYFVQESWYQEQYVRREHGGKPEHGRGHGKGRGKHDD